jgi:hypothetical protein
VDAFEGAVQGGRDRRTVLSCSAGFDVHVWGADFDAVFELGRVLLMAVHKHYSGSYLVERAQWVGFERPSWLHDGQVWVIRIALKRPITDAPWTTVPVRETALARTGAAPGDRQLTSGEDDPG